jgi:uncharacterized protein YdaU (DUF1376 family)
MPLYDPKAARAKRPCPIWVDAFLRDCLDLDSREIGAYVLILLKMWSNRECGVPDNENGLATICRMSLSSWRRKMGPRLERFWIRRDGWIFQKRLLIEAGIVEAFCLAQHWRKTGSKSAVHTRPNDSSELTGISAGKFPAINPEKIPGQISGKPLKSLGRASTGDHPRILPSQEPKLAATAAAALIPRPGEDLDLITLVERCELIIGPHIIGLSSFAFFSSAVTEWIEAGATSHAIISGLLAWARRDQKAIPATPQYFWPIIVQAMNKKKPERKGV